MKWESVFNKKLEDKSSTKTRLYNGIPIKLCKYVMHIYEEIYLRLHLFIYLEEKRLPNVNRGYF